ncbi:MAG: MFS transporter [Alphaproteobacteria bacterium]|nr:MFS transporter [Alphaproteobacteria bacterium]
MPAWVGALFCTFILQASTAFLIRVHPVIGPALTEAAGVAPEKVGHLAAATALGTMYFLMVGGALLPRLGPVRLLQYGSLFGAAALALSITGNWWAMMASAFLVGVGYGPSPPAGSDILHRFAPQGHQGLVFSIKQSAVPLGGAIAGAVIAPIAAYSGWRLSLWVGVAIALVPVLVVQPLRAKIDTLRDPRHPVRLLAFLSVAKLWEPFHGIRLAPALIPLTYAGFCFAIVQGCLFAFLTTFLTAEVGVPLAVAGGAFAVMQGVGIASRIGMGWVSDRIGSAVVTLRLLGLASATMTILTAQITAAWAWPVAVTVIGITGFAAASWNGVKLAEVARVAPKGRIGDATAASTFFTFIGYAVGPTGFVMLVRLLGSYGAAFTAIAVLPLSAAIVLFWAKPPAPRAAPGR